MVVIEVYSTMAERKAKRQKTGKKAKGKGKAQAAETAEENETSEDFGENDLFLKIQPSPHKFPYVGRFV